jgi:hypothetical protein
MPPARPWRRVVAALGATVAAFAAAACDRTSAEPPAPSLDVGLTVDARRDPDALRIGYTLVNRTSKPLVVFSGVPARDTHEKPAVDSDAVYVTARDDGTVEIAKRVFAPPEGVGLAVDFVVRGAVVAPGQSAAEAVRIPLPLAARHPYDKQVRLPTSAKRAVFCLGVAEQSAVPALPVASGDADGRSVYPHRASVARVQQVVCGDPFDL